MRARLRIAEDGTILRDSQNLATTGDGMPALEMSYGTEPGDTSFNAMLKWEGLPPPVGRTVEQQAQGREFADLLYSLLRLMMILV